MRSGGPSTTYQLAMGDRRGHLDRPWGHVNEVYGTFYFPDGACYPGTLPPTVHVLSYHYIFIKLYTVGTEIMFPLRSELRKITSLELRHNFDTTSLELRHNFARTSTQLAPTSTQFAPTSTQLCLNFDSTSLELRHNSLQLRHSFARTSTQFAPTLTQLRSNFDTASLELRLNFARTSI